MAELQPLNCGQKEILVAQWAGLFLKLCLQHQTEFTELYVRSELTQFEQIVQNMVQRIRLDSSKLFGLPPPPSREDSSFISCK